MPRVKRRSRKPPPPPLSTKVPFAKVVPHRSSDDSFADLNRRRIEKGLPPINPKGKSP